MAVFHYGDQRERDLSSALLEDGEQYPDTPEFAQAALIFHGFRDDVVPFQGSVEFVATHPGARLVLTDAGHELTEVLERMVTRTANFLETHS